MRRLLLIGILLLFLSAMPGRCQAARPQALVVIADHLRLADVTRADLPHLLRMRAGCADSLMSPGLAHGADPVGNAYASLGAGDTISVGDVSQGLLARALKTGGIRTALIGDADGDDTGVYRPASYMLPDPDLSYVGRVDGSVPDPAFPGGKRVDPALLRQTVQAALKSCDLVIVHDGDFARIEREDQRGDLLPEAYKAHRMEALVALDRFMGQAAALSDKCALLLVVPEPPLDRSGRWDQLTPFLSCTASPDLLRMPPNHLLATSDTTQTVGLIAARDIAPTILARLHLAAPIQMTGAAVRIDRNENAWPVKTRLANLDSITRLNQEVQLPFFWSIGFIGAFTLFIGFGLYAAGRLPHGSRIQRTALYGLRLQASWPLALLIAPTLHPATMPSYWGCIGLLTALLALLPSPEMIFSLTALVLIGDGLTGTNLVSQSVLSAYALSGIRFYGIGNEYMGILIGGALLACCLRNPNRPGSPHQPLMGDEREETLSPEAPLSRTGTGSGIALWFALVVFVLSFPAFGAKAGGAITASCTFFLAWRLLLSKPIRLKYVIIGIVGGLLLVFLWGALSHLLGMRRTHIETAVGALGTGRFGYILGVILRKIGLAVHVALHPGTLLGILAFALIGMGLRLLMRRRLESHFATHPKRKAVCIAGLWGCAVSVLFNDSGIVAAILLIMCLVLMLLHGIFQETNAPHCP